MKLSIVSHYYNNAEAVLRILASFREMEARFPGSFDFVLVDDHSHERMDAADFAGVPNLRVYRIVEDVPWNMAGARNVGMLVAKTNKVFITDIDHIVHPEDIGKLLQVAESLPPRKWVHMSRLVEYTDGLVEPTRSVFNCFLMHRDDFFNVGGYEEAFSGHYGHEDKWFSVCCNKNGIESIKSEILLVVRKELGTKELDRDTSRNRALLDGYLEERKFRSRNCLGYGYERVF